MVMIMEADSERDNKAFPGQGKINNNGRWVLNSSPTNGSLSSALMMRRCKENEEVNELPIEIENGRVNVNKGIAWISIRCGNKRRKVKLVKRDSEWRPVSIPRRCLSIIHSIIEYVTWLEDSEYEYRRLVCIATGHCEYPMYDVIHVVPGGDP